MYWQHICRWAKGLTAKRHILGRRERAAHLPGATILSLNRGEIRPVTYQETDHYRVTKDFLNAPERFYRHLFENEADE
jgi:hypothetical protein